jgi:hypothetical protein
MASPEFQQTDANPFAELDSGDLGPGSWWAKLAES